MYFEWSDERIYCSELVWKIYKKAVGVNIGKLQRFSKLNLENEEVRQKMIERYGEEIPGNEKISSPESIFASQQLITVMEK